MMTMSMMMMMVVMRRKRRKRKMMGMMIHSLACLTHHSIPLPYLTFLLHR